MKRVIVKINDGYPYAVVKYTNNIFRNEKIAVVCIFDTKKEFEKEIKKWNKEDDPYTMGSDYKILYKRNEKFQFDDK